MKVFKKNYIGKGTKVPKMQIVRATVRVSELLNFKYEFEGEEYVTFEVAKMQNADQFGRDHTVYCTTKEDVEEEEPAKQPGKRRKKQTASA